MPKTLALRLAAGLVTLCASTIVGAAAIPYTEPVSFAQSASLTPVPTQVVPCNPNVVPIGQNNPPSEPMPLNPAWCNTFTTGPSSNVSGADSWVDDWHNSIQMQRLDDGDAGYRVFNNFSADNFLAQRASVSTEHFINNQGFFEDIWLAGQTNAGGTLRPNRSFTFTNGMLVVEGDISPGMADYPVNGRVFNEFDISMASAPTGVSTDSLYGYGQFGGYWTVGCRFDGATTITCSVESSATNISDNAANCNASAPSRIMEVGYAERCGATHIGGDDQSGVYARTCPSNTSYDLCNDRYRMELTKTGITVYVNGQLEFEDSGWDTAHQLPDSMISGQVYVYFDDWLGFANATNDVFRYNWDRIAVNPTNANGTLALPSASPSYLASHPALTPSPTLAPPTATSTPPPTATSTLTPTTTRVTSTPTPCRRIHSANCRK